MLSLDQQRVLFRLIREAISARLEGRALPAVPRGDPVMEALAGAFVTLRSGASGREGELRGCIGHASARLPLAEAVRTLAVSAAVHDRRFEPVSLEELTALQVELSVLSPLFPLEPERVEVGQHGLVVTRGTFSGLLLPQVASERAWSRDEFLAQTCRKARLPADAWKLPGTQLQGFTCDVYEEPAD